MVSFVLRCGIRIEGRKWGSPGTGSIIIGSSEMLMKGMGWGKGFLVDEFLTCRRCVPMEGFLDALRMQVSNRGTVQLFRFFQNPVAGKVEERPIFKKSYRHCGENT